MTHRANSQASRRVLWLIKGLGAGGAEQLLSMNARLHTDCWQIQAAYLLPWKTALVEEIEELGIPTTCLGARNSWDPSWLVRLRKLLVSDEIDIVHVHSPLAAVGARLVVRSIGPSRRPGLVSSEHNLWSSHRRLTAALNALTFSLDDEHIAVSSAVRDSLPQRYRARTRVVRHGVDTAAIRAASDRDAVRAELGLGDGDLVVMTIANLRATKGYPDLLRAAQSVLRDVPQVHFVAVGQGPLESELVALRDSLGLGERFRFLGFRSDAVRVLSGADIFCMASHQEGLPVAMMEALALGVPVVATDVGGIPELVTNGREAALVAPYEPAALASALARVLMDPVRRKTMGSAAIELSESFGLEAAIRDTERVYTELLGQ